MVSETKMGRDRIVPISLHSANALRSHFKAHIASEYVFIEPQTGQPLRKENFIRRSFRPLLKRAGFPAIRFHDLRHGTATRLLVQGVHPKVVQDRLGHSSITVTLDTYSHAIPSLGRKAARPLRPRSVGRLRVGVYLL